MEPWNLPLLDGWGVHEERLVNRVLAPGEAVLLEDIKGNGFLMNFTLVADSPRVQVSMKLAAPGGFDTNYSATAEQLHTWGFNQPPGNHALYGCKFDTTNHIYSIRISPPFPGPPFRGGVSAVLKNEGTTPCLIILGECVLLIIESK